MYDTTTKEAKGILRGATSNRAPGIAAASGKAPGSPTNRGRAPGGAAALGRARGTPQFLEEVLGVPQLMDAATQRPKVPIPGGTCATPPLEGSGGGHHHPGRTPGLPTMVDSQRPHPWYGSGGPLHPGRVPGIAATPKEDPPPVVGPLKTPPPL
ncbi:proline-rich proteoglycan 2-like [Homarus americanus]|uniref:proline-rich proteoglycan 2-like n=1 Tax=Homarus americanus TaxID=6706 RepID=UPI001C450BE0|nr:proline-rich proteoglycan 2-like [Homarus americanus]XP_042236056.1 proline-rich proteoglycan 2-like [Homarus americanus]